MSEVLLRAVLLSELTAAPGSSQRFPNRRFAYYRKAPVLVDPKTYGDAPRDQYGDLVYNRVVDLARTLGLSRSDDYLTLQCIGFFEKDMQFCFLYSLPADCEPPPTPTPPKSLFDHVNSSFKPSVTTRIQLAYRLAYSISKIHNEGWLHKGIRSDNVLFFPKRWGAPRSLDSPRLVGFDFARRDLPEEYSEKPVNTETNIYRHPSALRDPDITFRREHDYYGLGIVMVEIAAWRSIKSILKNRADLRNEECTENDVKKVRGILLDADSQENHPRDIAFRMGDIYWNVVKTCLTGEFGVPEDAEEQLLSAYQRDVVDELKRCVI